MGKFNFGSRFLPRIGKSNSKAEKKDVPQLKDVELYPKLRRDEEHPLPFYESGEVTLTAQTDPPWKEDQERDAREKFQAMMEDPKLAKHFRDTFLKETVEEEIMAIASSILASKSNEKHRDESSVVVMEEEILVPTIQREVFTSVWDLLYDWGRDLPFQEYKELQQRESELQMDDASKEYLTLHMFEGRSWSDDLTEERKLSGHRWDTLLYNYYSKLVQNSFKRNVALHILQEFVVSNVAADEVLNNGVLKYLEKDMTHLDEKEKMDVPPRKG